MKVQYSSQFFRDTTDIQSGADTFDDSRFIMTFLTIFRVTEMLCSFILVLAGNTGKEIPDFSILELSEKHLANNFAISDT